MSGFDHGGRVRDLTPQEVAKGVAAGPHAAGRHPRAERDRGRALPRRGGAADVDVRSGRSRSGRQGGGVRVPLGQPLGAPRDRAAGRRASRYDAHLAGGILAWKAAGLPTEELTTQGSVRRWAASRAARQPLVRPKLFEYSTLDEPGLRQPAGLRVRGDVAARAQARGGQPRPGLSRRSRPRGRAAQGGRGGGQRLEPVSVDARPARAAPGDRRALPALARTSRSIPTREIMVTSGATEAIAGSLLALIEPGDEVVMFQPLYDAYLPLVQRAGGVPRFVRLEPPHWRFTEEMLARRVHAATPSWCCSTTRSIRPAPCSRATTSSCSRASARSSTPSRCATRCGST